MNTWYWRWAPNLLIKPDSSSGLTPPKSSFFCRPRKTVGQVPVCGALAVAQLEVIRRSAKHERKRAKRGAPKTCRRFSLSLNALSNVGPCRAAGANPNSGPRPLRVGTLQLRSDVILAPLERVTDVGFRRLCFQNGAGLTWTEMVYSSEMIKDKSTAVDSVDTYDPETLTGVQFIVDRTSRKNNWGIDTLRGALDRLEYRAMSDMPHWRNICAVDLNFGCPTRGIVERGAGPALLRRRSKMRALFEVLRDWQRQTRLEIGAIGAKIRLGLTAEEQSYKVYLPVTEAATESLDYLVVHARHGEQRSRDPPTWEAIAEVKAASVAARAPGRAPLVIVGNGDVRTPADAERMQGSTGCDAVMVGRAAMHNPWSLRTLSGLEEPSMASTWPSIDTIKAAEVDWKAWTEALPGHSRFKSFHVDNFARMRSESQLPTGEHEFQADKLRTQHRKSLARQRWRLGTS